MPDTVSTGWQSGTVISQVVDGDVNWSNLSNLTARNGTPSTGTSASIINALGTSKLLVSSLPDFSSVGNGSTPIGLQVRVCLMGGVFTFFDKAFWRKNGVNFGSNLIGTPPSLTGSFVDRTYGSASSISGWTLSELKTQLGFGIRFQGGDPDDGLTTVYAESIEFNLTYEPASSLVRFTRPHLKMGCSL